MDALVKIFAPSFVQMGFAAAFIILLILTVRRMMMKLDLKETESTERYHVITDLTRQTALAIEEAAAAMKENRIALDTLRSLVEEVKTLLILRAGQ